MKIIVSSLLLVIFGIFVARPAMSAEYVIVKAKHSGKCAQVDQASDANGANISQWDCVNQDNVKWQKVPAGDGYFFLKVKHSGKCAQVDGGSLANGANISQWDCVNQKNVKWKVKPVRDSYFFLSRLP